MKSLVSALVAIAYFCSCNSLVTGSDTITVVERGVAGYSAVSVEDGINLVIADTPKGNVSVRANDNILQYIKTTVENDVLVVYIQRGVSFRQATMTVTVSGYGLKNISASGGSGVEVNRSPMAENVDIELNGGSRLSGIIDAKTLDIELSGGSNLTLLGLPANQLDLESSGGSQSEIAIEAGVANLEVSGGGKAYVWVSDRLNATLSGGSQVIYKGTAVVGEVDASGGSTLSHSDWK